MMKRGPVRWKVGCLAKAADQLEYDEVMLTVPRCINGAKTIADFGYKYTDDTKKLVQMSNGTKPFAWLGQKHYDKLGDAIVEELYSILRTQYGFAEVRIPQANHKAGEPTVPVFVSPNFDSAEVVVFLSQGSGAVRPGMWARALCINDSLHEGAIFSYLDQCLARNWGVLVLNPNDNYTLPAEPGMPTPTQEARMTPEQIQQYWLGTPDKAWKKSELLRRRQATPIEGSFRPEVHALACWDTFIQPNPRPTVIIAHSYGGKCTTALLRHRFPLFSKIVAGIAWTDALNDLKRKHDDPSHVGFMQENSVNWVASKKPLDTREIPHETGCVELSSGHDTHEWTSASCQTSVFPFLEEKLSRYLQSINARDSEGSGDDDGL